MQHTSEPSRARSLYEAVKASVDPFAHVANMVGKPLDNCEGEYLDFKGADRLDVTKDDFKRIWSKALSGFANSDGGVVVWGIDAPQNVPERLSLVPDLTAFHARLLELLPNATDPPVQNVELLPIPQPGNQNCGFMVCLIPSSPWRPHKAKFAGNEYYIRAGDNHVPASQSVLRALFFPQHHARIGIYFRVTKRIVLQTHEVFACFWLKNEGPATAEQVFILCNTESSIELELDRIWAPTTSAYRGVAGIATRPFHPTEMINLFAVRIGVISTEGIVHLGSQHFDFRFNVYLKNEIPQIFMAKILPQDVDNDRAREATRII